MQILKGVRARASGRRSDHETALLEEQKFLRLLCLERKRSERSGKPVLLILLDGGSAFGTDGTSNNRERVAAALMSCTRETDLVGWYRSGAVMGTLFTELCDPPAVAIKVLYMKIATSLGRVLRAKEAGAVIISVHLFPEPVSNNSGEPTNFVFYPELLQQRTANKSAAIAKRVIDMCGSLMALVLLMPVFLLIAALIKITSKGPVLFRQTRVGQYAQPFVFLKFRSMYLNCDAEIHKEYVTRFIAGLENAAQPAGNGDLVYKITNDRRVTPLGRFLRRTSLDELPQIFNVLKGEMSLVGPRPAVPYEFDCYTSWHRRRVLAAKPGITGLWQVNGRSRTSFDDMVRLDLKYIKEASMALDLKILLQTPLAVLSGSGAY